MASKKIKITCDIKSFVPIDHLVKFQGDLKTIEPEAIEKLKKSIVKYGFSFPIFMWQLKILDGHQRIEAVISLIKDGYELENNVLPVVPIKAKNEKEAAEKLLLINSRYAKIRQLGFDLFVEEFKLDIIDMGGLLDIPEIDFDSNVSNDADEIIEKEGLEYKISIDCDDEKHQVLLIEKLEEMGLKCRPLIL